MKNAKKGTSTFEKLFHCSFYLADLWVGDTSAQLDEFEVTSLVGSLELNDQRQNEYGYYNGQHRKCNVYNGLTYNSQHKQSNAYVS